MFYLDVIGEAAQIVDFRYFLESLRKHLIGSEVLQSHLWEVDDSEQINLEKAKLMGVFAGFII